VDGDLDLVTFFVNKIIGGVQMFERLLARKGSIWGLLGVLAVLVAVLVFVK
jgi:hypothetical protein